MFTSHQRRNWNFKRQSKICSLPETIVAGWSEDFKDLPNALRPYHNHCDEMTIKDGLILKGEAPVIHLAERERILQAIQASYHQMPVQS